MEEEALQKSPHDWREADRRVVWHAMFRYLPNQYPFIAREGKGVWITDIDGKRYLDGMSGLWCVNVGYGREELAAAAYEQLKVMSYYPLTQGHLPAIELGEKLNQWLGEEYVIFFTNSGSEANETAFKLVRQYHQQQGQGNRYKFISRYRAYHGNTMGALAATGQAQRKYRYEPLAAGFLHVPPPDCYRCPFHKHPDSCTMECAQAVEQLMVWELDETIAGVIMEPIITGGGILMPPPDYMKQVKEACERHGALLIVDEVICGFGRIGHPFGFMEYGVTPDVITMAKGMTSGYLPLAATAVRKEVFEKFISGRDYDHFRHLSTFGGNPAACKLALRNLTIMEDERLFDRSAELGERILHQLSPLLDHPLVGDIRGKGLLIGIELVADKEGQIPARPEQVSQILERCKDKGLLLGKNGDTVAGYNNVLTLAPPLSLLDEEADFLVETLLNAFADVG